MRRQIVTCEEINEHKKGKVQKTNFVRKVKIEAAQKLCDS